MFEQEDELFAVVLNKGFDLLEHFARGISLPRWLAPLSMVGVLSALVKLFPSLQKGSLLAGIGSYLLLGLLIVNMLALSLFLYSPGKLITCKTPSVAQTGLVLLKLLLMGLLVMLKTVIAYSIKLIFDLSVLLLAALTYPPRQTPGQITAHC